MKHHIKGYENLSDAGRKHFHSVFKIHQSVVGNTESWKPIKVKEHRTYIEVHFKNGEWLHYYANGTWG